MRAALYVMLTVLCNDCKCGKSQHVVFTLTVDCQLRCQSAHVKHLNSQVTQEQATGAHVDQQLLDSARAVYSCNWPAGQIKTKKMLPSMNGVHWLSFLRLKQCNFISELPLLPLRKHG